MLPLLVQLRIEERGRGSKGAESGVDGYADGGGGWVGEWEGEGVCCWVID